MSERQREEGPGEVLVFIVDESYGNELKYIGSELFDDEQSLGQEASRRFREELETEFETEFFEANVGPGADLPSFGTVISDHPVISSILAAFFAGKQISENMQAWSGLIGRLRKFFSRKVVLNRHGASLLALDAIFSELGGMPKSFELRGYLGTHRDFATEIPQGISDAPPTLNLSQVVHVFRIVADGVEFEVAVDEHKAEIRRIVRS